MSAEIISLPYTILFQQTVPVGTAMMLTWAGQYAVCRRVSEVVVSPNYADPGHDATMSGHFTPHGLREVLHWTDRNTALARYQAIVGTNAREWLSLVRRTG